MENLESTGEHGSPSPQLVFLRTSLHLQQLTRTIGIIASGGIGPYPRPCSLAPAPVNNSYDSEGQNQSCYRPPVSCPLGEKVRRMAVTADCERDTTMRGPLSGCERRPYSGRFIEAEPERPSQTRFSQAALARTHF